MTKKDLTNQENIEREKDAGSEVQSQPYNDEKVSSGGYTYVKNANAAGDGAFGRNESSVPEEEETGKKREADPPY